MRASGRQSADLLSSPAHKLFDGMPDLQLPSFEKCILDDGMDQVVEFDADSLFRMVGNLEYNMRQSQVESSRGRMYESYRAKRDEKLRERWRSKDVRRRLGIDDIEESFALTWGQMKAQFGRPDGTQNRPIRDWQAKDTQRNSQQGGRRSSLSDELSEGQVQDYQHKFSDDMLLGDNSSKSTTSMEPLSSKSASSTPLHPSYFPKTLTRAINSNLTKQQIQSQNYPEKALRDFNNFRKENVKPAVGIGKVKNSLESVAFNRSKSAAGGIRDSKEEKLIKFNHTRSRSVSYGELMDMSRFSKKQSEKIMHSKIHKKGESKPYLRRGSGIGPGAGATIVKMRASKISDVPIEEDEHEDLENYMKSSPDLLQMEVKQLKARPVIALNDDDIGSYEEMDKTPVSVVSGSKAFPTNVEVSQKEITGSRNLNPHLSHFLRSENLNRNITDSICRSSPAPCISGSIKEMNMPNPEKLNVSTNSSDQSLKNVVKGFKKLLKFGRKNKHADSMAKDSTSLTTSEGY